MTFRDLMFLALLPIFAYAVYVVIFRKNER